MDFERARLALAQYTLLVEDGEAAEYTDTDRAWQVMRDLSGALEELIS